jgi:hypothetical protein
MTGEEHRDLAAILTKITRRWRFVRETFPEGSGRERLSANLSIGEAVQLLKTIVTNIGIVNK